MFSKSADFKFSVAGIFLSFCCVRCRQKLDAKSAKFGNDTGFCVQWGKFGLKAGILFLFIGKIFSGRPIIGPDGAFGGGRSGSERLKSVEADGTFYYNGRFIQRRTE